jgi:hypothetical protein
MARRAIEVIEHPLLRRNYRVATAAIESFVDLVERCLRVSRRLNAWTGVLYHWTGAVIVDWRRPDGRVRCR